jgi:hypothetical protein
MNIGKSHALEPRKLRNAGSDKPGKDNHTPRSQRQRE